MSHGPIPARYYSDEESRDSLPVVMFGSKLAHRRGGAWYRIGGDVTLCGKSGGNDVSYLQFRKARKSWMCCNVCWSPERIKRRW